MAHKSIKPTPAKSKVGYKTDSAKTIVSPKPKSGTAIPTTKAKRDSVMKKWGLSDYKAPKPKRYEPKVSGKP